MFYVTGNLLKLELNTPATTCYDVIRFVYFLTALVYKLVYKYGMLLMSLYFLYGHT